MATLRVWLILAAMGLALAPASVRAQAAWLDAPLANWNVPGQAVPAAPPGESFDPRCPPAVSRPPEIPPDAAVSAAGWTLYGTYQGGWGVVTVQGLSSYDGMCRPFGAQVFVFVDGAFAGTLSPVPMDARTDGFLSDVLLTNVRRSRSGAHDIQLAATFLRYAQGDPLCCPSGETRVQYAIERGATGPLVVPVERFDPSR